MNFQHLHLLIAQKPGYGYNIFTNYRQVLLPASYLTPGLFPEQMCVDLHTHSIYSDGSSTPAELVELAAKKGLKGLALTDHDTVAGVAELLDSGSKAGISILSGVEISATHGELDLHILGYGIAHDSVDLNNWLQPLQKGRKERNALILASLRDLGMDVTAEEVQAISCCGQTGRPHIAKLLVQKHYVNDMNQAFRELLGQDQPAYHPRFSYSVLETIDTIHSAGGMAVLAHPGQLDPACRLQPPLLRELSLRGLDGMEVYYPSHTRKMRKKLYALAIKNNLLITGGSDFHGSNRPSLELAGQGSVVCPPDWILDKIRARQNQQAA